MYRKAAGFRGAEGLSADKQRWTACRRDFFLPVRVLSRFFRRRFLEMLEHAFNAPYSE